MWTASTIYTKRIKGIKDLMMGLQRRGPSIVAVKSNTAVPVKETVFIATAMPSCRNGRAGVWKHLFVCIEIRT